MGQRQLRRCAIWLDTDTFRAAQELAELSGVDIDDFIEFIVKELHQREEQEGALHARAERSGQAPVIPLAERRRQRQRRRG